MPARILSAMTSFSLASRLSYCVIDATAIFLDVARDRYFLLSPGSNAAFLAWLGGEALPARERQALQAAGILIGSDSCPPIPARPPTVALREAEAIRAGPFDLAELARALWMQRRIANRLRKKGLDAMLTELEGVRTRSQDLRPHASEDGARVLRAFELARLLQPSANACLPRSVAMAVCLARHRIRADVVIGVRIKPFAAHCWVQANGEILNDSVGEATRFTPILAA